MSRSLEPWWKSAVIYQIYPRSFAAAGGSGVGDLRGITSRLPYVADLGVDAIWISPFFKSPMRDFGYDVEDHRLVDPLFGTNADFQALLSRAHELGLRVLIDLVLSHCSDAHPWFQACLAGRGSPYDEAFVWAEPGPDGGPPNNWLSVFGGPAWTYHPARGQYYLHNFLSSQPDLNYHCPLVRAEAFNVARYWLERGVDGFRLDAINFCLHDEALRDNPPALNPDQDSVQLSNPYGGFQHLYDKNHPEIPTLLAELRSVVDDYPERVLLGEIGASRDESKALMSEYTGPEHLHLCYSFDLLSAPLESAAIEAVFRRLKATDERFWGCWALSNHDVVRSASRLTPVGADPASITAASLAMLLTLRGTPCLYQGEELGLSEAEVPYSEMVDPYGIAFYPDFKGRDGCRTPMPWDHRAANMGFCPDEVRPWLPLSEAHRCHAVTRALDDERGVLHLTRELLALRRQFKVLSLGEMVFTNHEHRVICWERRYGNQAAVCAFNLSGETLEMTLPRRWESMPGVWRGLTETEIPGRVSMAPWSWYVLVTVGPGDTGAV